MELKHTPGPWHYKPGHGMVLFDSSEKLVLSNDRSGEEYNANQNLIVAAPELIEALERIVRMLEVEDARLANFGETEAARAAILKATGAQA